MIAISRTAMIESFFTFMILPKPLSDTARNRRCHAMDPARAKFVHDRDSFRV